VVPEEGVQVTDKTVPAVAAREQVALTAFVVATLVQVNGILDVEPGLKAKGALGEPAAMLLA
jgi:hypothetical protein